jgi:hypothetical protein
VQVLDILRDAQGGHSLESLAMAYGISPAQAEAVVAAVVPELARNLERNTLSRGGLADLVTAIGSGRHEGFLNDPNVARSPAVRDEGNAILGHIVGSRDKSRAIARLGAMQAGVGEAIVKAMLPTIAAMVMGAIAKGMKGGLGEVLGRLPGGGGQSRRPAGGGWNMPGGRTDPGFGDHSPLPLPGEGTGGGRGTGGVDGGANPYGDIADILRRGGGSGGAGGGMLWNVVRSVLGGLLGFQSRGLMSWIIKAVIARWGWQLLRTILGRAIGSR